MVLVPKFSKEKKNKPSNIFFKSCHWKENLKKYVPDVWHNPPHFEFLFFELPSDTRNCSDFLTNYQRAGGWSGFSGDVHPSKSFLGHHSQIVTFWKAIEFKLGILLRDIIGKVARAKNSPKFGQKGYLATSWHGIQPLLKAFCDQRPF